MKQFNSYSDVPKDFTGACKLLIDDAVRYFKNGKRHREDGPAVEHEDLRKSWYYKGKCYGIDFDFINESWKEKVEYLKREEELEIFK